MAAVTPKLFGVCVKSPFDPHASPVGLALVVFVMATVALNLIGKGFGEPQ